MASAASTKALAGVGTPAARPMVTTAPWNHGISIRLPRSRSSAMLARIIGGKPSQ
jgi:hypothetical protein